MICTFHLLPVLSIFLLIVLANQTPFLALGTQDLVIPQLLAGIEDKKWKVKAGCIQAGRARGTTNHQKSGRLLELSWTKDEPNVRA